MTIEIYSNIFFIVDKYGIKEILLSEKIHQNQKYLRSRRQSSAYVINSHVDDEFVGDAFLHVHGEDNDDSQVPDKGEDKNHLLQGDEGNKKGRKSEHYTGSRIIRHRRCID